MWVLSQTISRKMKSLSEETINWKVSLILLTSTTFWSMTSMIRVCYLRSTKSYLNIRRTCLNTRKSLRMPLEQYWKTTRSAGCRDRYIGLEMRLLSWMRSFRSRLRRRLSWRRRRIRYKAIEDSLRHRLKMRLGRIMPSSLLSKIQLILIRLLQISWIIMDLKPNK